MRESKQLIEECKKHLRDTEKYKHEYKKDIRKLITALEKQLAISGVVNCVYVVTERDQYGEQLFKGVFANREKAVEYLAEDGLNESNIDEINEIELH